MDPVLAEQVAQSLVSRAQELFDARLYADAKQLAFEALRQSPKGPAGDQARFLVREANKKLNLANEALPGDPIDVKVTAVEEPADNKVKVEVEPLPQPETRSTTQLGARVHGSLYLGLVGATIGSFFSKQNPAAGAVPVGIAGAVAGALVMPTLENKLGWTEAQTRTMGSTSTWGGVIGGFMADAVKKDGTNARHVLVGGSIGATLGGLAGAGIATTQRFTRGDVALVDTFAGMGTLGGLTLGMLMQPAEGEAYSVNAIVGAVGGYLTGYIAAPLTDTTQKRMIRVAGASLIGGAAPFLLYAIMYDDTSHADERTVGLLSTAGLVVGAYVGFRLTRDMAEGLDTKDGAKPKKDDATVTGLVHRHAAGHWSLGSLGVTPLSTALAPQPGAALPLVGGTW